MVHYVRDNDLATAQLLVALGRSGFEGRLILASSMVVYGEGRYRCRTHGVGRPGPRVRKRLARGLFEPVCPECGAELAGEVVDEATALDPRKVYAATKLYQEHLCAAFARERSVPLAMLRYHDVYGPGMPRDTPYAGVAAIFASSLRRGEPPRVFEDGRRRRDFVLVSDVAQANLLALSASPAPTGPLKVASGRAAMVLGLAQALSDACGPGASRPVVTGEHRLGDVRHIVASPERAARTRVPGPGAARRGHGRLDGPHRRRLTRR